MVIDLFSNWSKIKNLNSYCLPLDKVTQLTVLNILKMYLFQEKGSLYEEYCKEHAFLKTFLIIIIITTVNILKYPIPGPKHLVVIQK